MSTTITEVANELSKSQKKIVDALTEQAPLLGIMPFESSTHRLFHSYEKLTEVTGATFGDIDAAPSTVGIESGIYRQDLSVLSGIETAGIDAVSLLGGMNAWMAKRLPLVLKKTGANVENDFYYNLFRQSAIDNGNVQQGTGTTGSCYSMTVIRFEEGTCTGLYDPEGYGDGKLLYTEKLNGGAVYPNASNQLVHGYHLRGYTGGLVADNRHTASIVNVKLVDVDDSGFDQKIDDMIIQARADMGNSVIVMHPTLKSRLNYWKASKLQLGVNDNNFNRTLDAWEGVPILTSYNLSAGAEADVVL